MISWVFGGSRVDIKYHHMGIGTSLVNRAKELYEDLEIDVFEKNEQGSKFYEKMGFVFVNSYTEKNTGETINHLRLQT